MRVPVLTTSILALPLGISSDVHRYFCLHDFLAEISKTSFEVNSVHNDRHSNYLTCREWGKNLESKRKEIVKFWGERVYRIFRLYLWGASHLFFNGAWMRSGLCWSVLRI